MPSPGSQMSLVIVLWRSKNRRSYRCLLHNIVGVLIKNKEHRLYLYASILLGVDDIIVARQHTKMNEANRFVPQYNWIFSTLC